MEYIMKSWFRHGAPRRPAAAHAARIEALVLAAIAVLAGSLVPMVLLAGNPVLPVA